MKETIHALRSALARPLSWLAAVGWLFVSPMLLKADSTWLYAVQLSATIQTNPPQLTLNWLPDPYGTDSHVVYRKKKDASAWGPGITLPGSALAFTDSDVSAGVPYEYQVVKHASLGYTGYGYICVGIAVPVIEDRGKLILIVAADSAAIASELSQLQSDLTGDGWTVIRHDLPPGEGAVSVKNRIQQDYFADPARVTAVFLFGHVPIFMSGTLNYDSHGARALPADAFYGDMDGDWAPNLPPENRPSYMPSDIELMVGRVDFVDMPGNGADPPWPSETEMLRKYLTKDHAWRHKLFTVPRRALIANRAGDAGGMAYAASGYRNFQPMVGPGGIIEANVEDNSPISERWISRVTDSAWLWTYACGGGLDNVISHLGVHGLYNEVWSTDIVKQDAKVVFAMLFGSHFGDWSRPDNVMRSMLATSTGLAVSLAGLPHWYVHHMALGEPIGYGTRLTMNNTTLYKNQVNALPRAVLVDLLGDPTLRLDQVAPPSGLAAHPDRGAAMLSWAASPDANAGYHVYRASLPQGPFTRVTSAPVMTTAYLDSTTFPSAARTYMVRAIALQATSSGSYYNPSQGAFVTVEVTTPPVPVTVSAVLRPSGIQLAWNSQPGAVYHVEAWSSRAPTWADISGPLTANSNTTSFLDTDRQFNPSRWYRVAAQ